MVEPVASALIVIAISWLPIYAGGLAVLGMRSFKRVSTSLLAALSAGAMISFFPDVLGDATALGINFGFLGSPSQLALLAGFAVGLLLLRILERPSSIGESKSLLLAYLFALGISFHSVGEGVVIGFDLKTEVEFTLANRAIQAASFLLHKLAEGFTIYLPLVYVERVKARDFVLLGAISGLSIIAGTLVGLNIPDAGSYATVAFALGGGAIVYMISRLLSWSELSNKKLTPYVAILIGYLYMFLSGALHFTVV